MDRSTPIRYLSLFSGMEAAHLAFRHLGWECAAVAEIEAAPCALLAHRLPGVPNLGNVTDITDERIAELGRIDVVIGGSPCQDLSIAGKRAGLVGERSSLFHEQSRIFDAARSFCDARWLIWENVPGAFSSHKGRDFAVVVGTLAGLDLAVPQDGWGTEGVAAGPRGLVEWSVLDAQWFGLAQRRKRVFAVLDSGDWADRPPVLLERESLRGDSAPRREAREGAAGCTARSLAIRGRDGTPQAELGDDVANALLTPSGGRGGIGIGAIMQSALDIAPAITSNPYGDHESREGLLVMSSGQANAEIAIDVSTTLTTLRWAASASQSMNPSEVSPPIQATRNGEPATAVRRLTPLECERLQGADDDWTLVPRNGKPMKDGQRYKMLGNGFAVPCIRWIGQKIQSVHFESPRAAA